MPGSRPEELVVFRYEDEGVATLEDGLYVLEDVLKDPDYVLTLACVPPRDDAGLGLGARASRRGRPHRARVRHRGALKEKPQVRMMHEINQLTEGSDGALDPADYERTVATLLAGGLGAADHQPPVGAWTPVVSDAAALGQPRAGADAQHDFGRQPLWPPWRAAGPRRIIRC